MTKESIMRIHRIYNILLSAVIVIAGICLISGCLSIYYSGDQPYSREAVAEVFSKICIPIYLCLLMTLGGFIWEFISPVSCKKTKPEINRKHILERLTLKKDLTGLDESVINAIKKEQKLRKTHSVIRTLLIMISGTVFLVYALNPDNFHKSEINASMIKAMYLLIPCLAVSFAYSVFTAYFSDKSLQRETELIKNAPSAESVLVNEKNASPKKLNILRIILLVLGIAVLLYGFLSGGVADVLTKAVNICTECIGLG